MFIFRFGLRAATGICPAILLLGMLLMPGSLAAVPDPFYPTYSDVLSQLQALASAHPSIASYLVIGHEEHGTRDVVALKISDNVTAEEDEPAWAFTGFVHGSEQVGLRVLLDLA